MFKPQGWMSNSPYVLESLNVQCRRNHKHGVLLGGRAAASAIYSASLCKRILIGLKRQLCSDGMLCALEACTIAPEEEPHGQAWIAAADRCQGEQWGEFYDVSGNPLESSRVRAARREEIDEFKRRGVYTKVPVEECWRVTGRAPIGVRYVDVNKGDHVHPNYRSRLVATDVKRDSALTCWRPCLLSKRSSCSFPCSVPVM